MLNIFIRRKKFFLHLSWDNWSWEKSIALYPSTTITFLLVFFRPIGTRRKTSKSLKNPTEKENSIYGLTDLLSRISPTCQLPSDCLFGGLAFDDTWRCHPKDRNSIRLHFKIFKVVVFFSLFGTFWLDHVNLKVDGRVHCIDWQSHINSLQYMFARYLVWSVSFRLDAHWCPFLLGLLVLWPLPRTTFSSSMLQLS